MSLKLKQKIIYYFKLFINKFSYLIKYVINYISSLKFNIKQTITPTITPSITPSTSPSTTPSATPSTTPNCDLTNNNLSLSGIKEFCCDNNCLRTEGQDTSINNLPNKNVQVIVKTIDDLVNNSCNFNKFKIKLNNVEDSIKEEFIGWLNQCDNEKLNNYLYTLKKTKLKHKRGNQIYTENLISTCCDNIENCETDGDALNLSYCSPECKNIFNNLKKGG